MSQNVKVVLFFSLLISISETSWGYAALSGYLSEVGHTNAKVGLAEGLQGMSQLVAALIAGEIADKVSRRKPLRVGIIVGLCSIVALWVAMFAPFSTDNDTSAYWVATFGLLMWGAFRGITLAPVDAIFADSVPTPQRAEYQVKKFVATLAGATMGPLLAVVLFKYFGDSWTKNELRIVIAAGTASSIVPLLSLFRLHDKHALDEDKSGPLLLSLDEEKNDILSQRIRILCFLADLSFGIASGMTIKFFPLFFRDKTHLTPGEVNAVTIATTFSMIFASRTSQTLSIRFGRMPVILAFKAIGIALLFVMAIRKDLWETWEIIIPIYCIRTVLMNSTAPLHKSILMDHCGKKERARWSALDSVITFGWSGSALLGGILADKHGFGYTFFITAVLQAVGFLFLIVLGFLVKEHSVSQPVAAGDTDGDANVNTNPNEGATEADDAAVLGQSVDAVMSSTLNGTANADYQLISDEEQQQVGKA